MGTNRDFFWAACEASKCEVERFSDEDQTRAGALLKAFAVVMHYKMSVCESPLELKLFLELHFALLAEGFGHKPGCRYYVEPQYEVFFEDRTYRLDFLVGAVLGDVERKIAVECDGHDFHERTKEQATRDKSRDRALQANSIPVFRFTGSEVFRNADECAAEVVRGLVKLFPNTGSER